VREAIESKGVRFFQGAVSSSVGLAIGILLIPFGWHPGPDLLLLDEPSEGLAPLIVQELRAITQEIVAEGITVLLVEQNLEMCLALAQRHYLMDHGLIVYHGTNEEFKANDEVKDRYLALSSLAKEFSEKEER